MAKVVEQHPVSVLDSKIQLGTWHGVTFVRGLRVNIVALGSRKMGSKPVRVK
jgi:hypothetical protein